MCGDSQARGWTGTAALGLCHSHRHSHSNARSEPRLWPTLQLPESFAIYASASALQLLRGVLLDGNSHMHPYEQGPHPPSGTQCQRKGCRLERRSYQPVVNQHPLELPSRQSLNLRGEEGGVPSVPQMSDMPGLIHLSVRTWWQNPVPGKQWHFN